MNDNTCGHECCSPDLEDGCTVDKCVDHPHEQEHIKRVDSPLTYCGRNVLSVAAATVPILLMATKTPADNICAKCLHIYTTSPEYTALTKQLEAEHAKRIESPTSDEITDWS